MSPWAPVSSLPRNTIDFLLCWRVDLLSLYLEQRANHWHWQNMSGIIGRDLLGQLTHRYPSDYCHQTFEITSNRITASSFLENSTSFMSVGFEGSNFVASSHSNFFHGCVPYINCDFDKRSHIFVIFIGISRSKIRRDCGNIRRAFASVNGRCSHFYVSSCIDQVRYWISPASAVSAYRFRLQYISSFCALRRRKPYISVFYQSLIFYCGMLGGGRWLVTLLNALTHWLLVKRHCICYPSVTYQRYYWCVLLRAFAGSYFLALFSVKEKSATVKGFTLILL